MTMLPCVFRAHDACSDHFPVVILVPWIMSYRHKLFTPPYFRGPNSSQICQLKANKLAFAGRMWQQSVCGPSGLQLQKGWSGGSRFPFSQSRFLVFEITAQQSHFPGKFVKFVQMCFPTKIRNRRQEFFSL